MRKIIRVWNFGKNRRVNWKIPMKHNSTLNWNSYSSAQRGRKEEQGFLSRIIYINNINIVNIIILLLLLLLSWDIVLQVAVVGVENSCRYGTHYEEIYLIK
jgi:hypothetical protein